MVHFTKHKLIIELETDNPAGLLYELQQTLFTLLEEKIIVWYGQPRSPVEVNCLTLLMAMQPGEKHYRRICKTKH